MGNNFFPQRPASHPMIYAYEDTNPQYKGLLKVGYTSVDVDKRVAQQYPTKRPDGSVPYRIVLRESAMYPDGGSFTDKDVHKMLRRKQITGMGGEWFKCTVDDVRAAIIAVRNHTTNDENRTQVFRMRPEQEDAVNRTIAYYRSAYEEGSTRTPKFLWNAKMRFGKTFASYELAKKMGFTRVLILTFKPAVQTAWREDLISHVDFEGWQFISRDANNLQDTLDLQYQRADKNKPIVCFGSFQDFLGVNKATGGIKANNEWVHTTNWDLVIFDEYHFGAWKDSAKKLFEQDEDSYDEDLSKYDRGNAYDETWLPITTTYYLYLSGTPFRALNSGEFIEEQIYNWTYSDEQRAKENWVGGYDEEGDYTGSGEYDENLNYVGSEPTQELLDSFGDWTGGYNESGGFDGVSEYDKDGNYVGPMPDNDGTSSGDTSEEDSEEDSSDTNTDSSDEDTESYSDEESDGWDQGDTDEESYE